MSQEKNILIAEILAVHKELFSGQTEKELLDDYYYLWEHGVSGLLDMAMSELKDLLEELKKDLLEELKGG